MSLTNIHATALIVGDRGLLIIGPSGSGKTTLALRMMQEAHAQGRHAALIADDQLFAESSGGRLIVHAPETIAGVAEVHGLGPRPIGARMSGQIDFVVELVGSDRAPRFQEMGRQEMAGVSLTATVLPARQTIQSALAISSWLGLQPFGR